MFSINRVIIEEAILQNNIQVIKSKLQNSAVDGKIPQIIAVLKGNAYGVGYQIMAQKLIENGINYFAVSEVTEGIKLRELGIDNDILVLNSTSIYEEVLSILEYNLIATVGSFETLNMLQRVAKENNSKIKIHLKIDTGFSRFGFLFSNIYNNEYKTKLVDTLQNSDCLSVEGTYTHFRESYDKKKDFTYMQYERFIKCTSLLKESGINIGVLHCANSSAFLKGYKELYLDAVRIGSAFLGRVQVPEKDGLKRLGYFESEVCEIKELPQGSKIGYSGTYTLKRDSKVAIVEAGYSDGIFVKGPRDSIRMIDKLRNLKQCLISFFKDETQFVYVNNVKLPVIGRVGMKNFAIDITGTDTKVGDKVKIDISLVLCNQAIERTMI